MKFITAKQKKRSAVSPVIATLLLIAIAVAAAIIVYAFVTGLIGGLTSSGASLVVESGTLTVPTGTSTGTLVVTVKNSASNPIQSIEVTNTAGLSINSATSVTPWTVNGAVVPIGSSASSSALICDQGGAAPCPTDATAAAGTLTAGTTYAFTVTVTFQNGGTNVQTLSLTAQI